MKCFKMTTLKEQFGDFVSEKVYLDSEIISFDELRYLSVLHVGFDGFVHVGEIIVHKLVAEEVLEIFKKIYELRFPIEKMRLMDYYGYSDELAMNDNNSSAFNFRNITNGSALSQHAFGVAIDINPVINPYIEGNEVLPGNGLRYVDREQSVLGMIRKGEPVYELFKSYGWTWGGDWTHIKDYHHFEKELKC